MKRAMVAAVAALVGGLLVSASTSSAAADKVDVCHSEGNGEFHLINVAQAAFGKHVEHGDSSPGEAVPGMDGFEFDADCVPVESVDCLGAVLFLDSRNATDIGLVGPLNTPDNLFSYSSGDGSCSGDVLFRPEVQVTAFAWADQTTVEGKCRSLVPLDYSYFFAFPAAQFGLDLSDDWYFCVSTEIVEW